jgi:hypothetical protein
MTNGLRGSGKKVVIIDIFLSKLGCANCQLPSEFAVQPIFSELVQNFRVGQEGDGSL